MKNTKVSKVMLSTLVTGGLAFSTYFASSITEAQVVEAPNITKGETQIELPSSALASNFKTSAQLYQEIREEGERIQYEREEGMRIELEKARVAEDDRLANIEAERKAKEEAERKAREEEERKRELQRQREEQQEQSQQRSVQSTSGIAMNGSYYTSTCKGCSGITATGYDVRGSIYIDGMRVIAVDPNVVSLYSIVEVSTPHETFEAIALDTGGAIKGHKVDILVADVKTAYSLGRHTVYVKVLRKGKIR